jgi:hypothetical protein
MAGGSAFALETVCGHCASRFLRTKQCAPPKGGPGSRKVFCERAATVLNQLSFKRSLAEGSTEFALRTVGKRAGDALVDNRMATENIRGVFVCGSLFQPKGAEGSQPT